ncbi:MAG: hypothetical protein RBU37_13450 [Myxococcota bacterium]|jgi:tetratricopeptide (TPR) repeat protein|nr:hypothetical protein [Myxococcota bacterium]
MANDIIRAKRYFERGVYYYELSAWGECVANMNDALELLPTHFEARMYLGAALCKQARYLDAIRILEEGRKQPLDEPSRLRLLRLLAVISAVRQDYPAAQYYLRQALRLSPEDPALVNLAASTYCCAGDFDYGLELFRKAIVLSDGH